MFEDMTYENIMDDMMSGFGSDVRTDEASLAYNACDRQALKLEEIYGDMRILEANMLPDTMELDYLIRYGEERSVQYHYATAPVVEGTFQQEIAAGTQFVCGDYTYTVTSNIDGFRYRLTCETEGTEANANVGELTPSDYVDDYKGGQITQILVLGTDDEDVEDYRTRVLDSFQSIAFGGNRASYSSFIDEIDGVGGCKPMRRDKGSQWIDIYLIDSAYGVPSDGLIKTVQALVDPEESHGEGDGMAAINQWVRVIAATGVTCNISSKLTLDSGYTADQVQTDINAAISEYLLNLRKDWEANDTDQMPVRISQIDSRIITVKGVLDTSSTTINGKAENLILSYEQIPLLGEVTLNV